MHAMRAQEQYAPGSVAQQCAAAIAIQPDRHRFETADGLFGSNPGFRFIGEAGGGASTAASMSGAGQLLRAEG